MSKLSLKALSRDGKSADSLRAASLVPAVVYGHKFGNTPVAFAYNDFAKAYKEAGHSVVISLSVDGKDESVLVKEVQRHPVSGRVQHADLLVLVATERVTAKIALEFTGDAPVKRDGGVVNFALHELEVKCFPKDLVKSFRVDLSKLDKIGAVVHLKDLGLSQETYHVSLDQDAALAVAAAPKKHEEEEAPAATAAVAAPAEGAAPAADAKDAKKEEPKK